MRSFAQWLEEKKKIKESTPPSKNSAPIKGANQDQSGVNTKNDNADYTISDAYDPNHPDNIRKRAALKTALDNIDAHYKKSENQIGHIKAKTKEFRANHAGFNKWLSDRGRQNPHKEETEITELVSGVGDVRTTPDNMKSTGHTGTSNTPSNARAMQSSADKRRMQLDKLAQRQKDQQEKDREQQQKSREQAQSLRDKMSKIQAKTSNVNSNGEKK